MTAIYDKLPPPIPSFNFSLTVARGMCGSIGWEAEHIPYVCAQVARMGRGEIGIDDEGNVVFHLTVTNDDIREQRGLISADEIWVILRPSPLLIDPYKRWCDD